MSVKENVRFDGQKEEEIGQPRVFPKISRVDLNDLMKKVREEENKNKRNNLAISIAALLAVVVFGIIITL